MINHQIWQKIKARIFVALISLFISPMVLSKSNVLLIVADDLNTRLGTYGDPSIKTPHIDALANQGIRFDRAYVQYPQCAQSRASFLTGLYPNQTGVVGASGLKKDFRDKVPLTKTLPQVFQDNGYHTARVGKIFHQMVPKGIGQETYDDKISWDERHNPKGIDRTRVAEIQYLGPLVTEATKKSNMNGGWLSYMRLGGTSNDYTDGRVTEQAISILEENAKIQSTQPLFLAVGYVRPHVPFSAPERFFDLYPLDEISIEDVPEFDRNDIPSAHLSDRPYQLDMTDQEKRIMIQAYYASISFIDEQVGKLISKLEELKLKESTLIIFVSDHGFLLGEHELWQKPNLFENTLRIPLIISDPRSAKAGLSSDSLIELIDIYPTILELSDLKIPEHVLGRSFAKLINRPSMPFRKSALSQSHARVTQPNLKKENIFGYSLRTEQFRYTEWAKGTHGTELYDHTNDSGENTNLSSHDAYQDVEAELRRLLRERIAESEVSPNQITER